MHSQHHMLHQFQLRIHTDSAWQSVLSSCLLTEKEEWSRGFGCRTRISALRILFLAVPQASLWSQMTTFPSSSPCLEWGPSCIGISKILIHCDNEVLCGPRSGVIWEVGLLWYKAVVVWSLQITNTFWEYKLLTVTLKSICKAVSNDKKMTFQRWISNNLLWHE